MAVVTTTPTKKTLFLQLLLLLYNLTFMVVCSYIRDEDIVLFFAQFMLTEYPQSQYYNMHNHETAMNVY